MRDTGNRVLLLFISLITIFLVSCQKEVSFDLGGNGGGPGPGGPGGGTGGNTTTNIEGDYDFVGISAHTVADVTINMLGDELKTVTTSDYVSQNNAGTVKINATQFITTGMAYDINGTMNARTYMNGVLLDNQNLPFIYSLPSTDGTSTYVRNSADSITVTGAVGVAPDPSGAPPTGPVGVKLSWSGDTLLMRIKATVTQNINQGGIPATFVGTVDGITKLKKK